MSVEGFDEFWRTSYDALVRSLTIAFGDRHLAEDAAQVGFERALRKWRSVSVMQRPGTWVYVVAVRHGRRHLDRERRRPHDLTGVSGQSSPDDGDPQGPVSDLLFVQELLGRLTPRQRMMVVLRHLAGLPLDDIASSLGISTGTVKSTLHDAYRRMRVEAERADAAERFAGTGNGVGALSSEEPANGSH